MSMPTMLDFFAGSGLVTEATHGVFKTVWALDICPKKADVYRANHGSAYFHLDSIENISGDVVPVVDLAWASFPCQDLSLAGNISGIKGKRSGLVWEWLRVVGEIRSKPQVLVAENVVGLISADAGAHYRALHEAIRRMGYKSGAVVLDAAKWLPQSRPRVFVISVPKDFNCGKLEADSPGWAHTSAVVRAASGLKDWVWWNIPEPKQNRLSLSDIVSETEPCDTENKTKRNLSLIPSSHQKKLLQALANGFKVAPGYKRTRNGKQVLELRFDQIAGCLRTPNGGSSRQVLVLKQNGRLVTRLLAVREAARLMGAPDTYKIPGTYNDGYKAMGDAVAVPVVRHLAKHLLLPLSRGKHV